MSGMPSFSEYSVAPLTFFLTLLTRELEAEELTTKDTLGPKNGLDIPPTSLLAKATLASSASNEDRSDPSPNLFNAASAGNSHSINGHEAFLGFFTAALTAAMAALSRSFVDDGILAVPPDVAPALKRYTFVADGRRVAGKLLVGVKDVEVPNRPSNSKADIKSVAVMLFNHVVRLQVDRSATET